MQEVLTILIVATAAAYLGRLSWLRLTRQQAGKCSSCPSCSSNDLVKSRPLINITLGTPPPNVANGAASSGFKPPNSMQTEKALLPTFRWFEFTIDLER